MLTSLKCLETLGEPMHENDLVVWAVPPLLRIDVVPKKLYCNMRMVHPLSVAFGLLLATGCVEELKTWDGCFDIRKRKGGTSYSLHSWGLAVDINAAWNKYGITPQFSPPFVKCFTDAGFDWGGDWMIPDGMHFQLRAID